MKRGILITLIVWALIGGWKWYQWDSHYPELACILQKQNVDRATQIWRSHKIVPSVECHSRSSGDVCVVFVPSYQVDVARTLVPGDIPLSE